MDISVQEHSAQSGVPSATREDLVRKWIVGNMYDSAPLKDQSLWDQN
jgi:hypothetical protein